MEILIRNNKILQTIIFSIITIIGIQNIFSQSKIVQVTTFDKIIISPHIEVVFKKGEKESVIINELKVPMEKLNIEVKANTLHIFLEGAKIATNTKTIKENGRNEKIPIYQETQAKIIVIYKDVGVYSLRGKEEFIFESPIKKNKVKFNIYGKSQTFINEVDINELRVNIYGESSLEIKKGIIEKQKFTAYGKSKVNTLGVTSKTIKITAYGDGNYQFKISDLLKVTSYGEATIKYKGNPKVSKGLIIGDTTIKKIE